MDKGIHIGGWGQIQGSYPYPKPNPPISTLFLHSRLDLFGITNHNQNGKLVGTNRLMSTDISPCWPAGIQATASAHTVGIAQSRMLSTPVLRPEAMERQIQTPGGKRSGVSLAGRS